ncbi:PREDICTED: 30S ribosomal protein S6 alpha, chloroplastic-like [Lupinus angustifolius]|nr:PREDICTED: 30S ribosomal protein S6 alpha, chloroplastic-like [Lupinus angustifolius]
MASFSLTSIPLLNYPFVPNIHTFSFKPLSSSLSLSFSNRNKKTFTAMAETLDFSSSLFEGGFGSDEDANSESVEEKEELQCPPGLRQYETMAVLRPDLTEDHRLQLTQKYEELLVAGGAMYVEVFNRGVIPLAYSIKKKNKAGETNNYLDGIYLLFTYFTKPDSINILEETLRADDDVIRSMTSKIRKRKY